MMIFASTAQIATENATRRGSAYTALPSDSAAPLPAVAQPDAPAIANKATNAATTTKQEDVRREQLDIELADANRKLAKDGNEVRFEYDREANSLDVSLIDTSTKEILRQFPSNEALHAARLVNLGKPLISLQA